MAVWDITFIIGNHIFNLKNNIKMKKSFFLTLFFIFFFTFSLCAQIQITEYISDVTCYGGSDGSIDITVTGGVPPYIYKWADITGLGTIVGQEDQLGLTAGDYKVVFSDSDSPANKDSIIYTVLESCHMMVMLQNFKNITCFGGADGCLDVEVSCHSTEVEYLWSTGDTSQDINNLEAGIYYLTATDLKCGYQDVKSFELIEPLPIDAYAEKDTSVCKGVNTELRITGGDYFLWSTGDTTRVITVTPDTTTDYLVTISDVNGCSISDTVSVFVDICNNINTQENFEEFKIYPNPLPDKQLIISLLNKQKCYTIFLYNQMGQLLNEYQTYNNSDFKIILDEMSPGIYFIKIDNALKSYTEKIIIE
jgi:hypothetical protein